MYYKAIDFIYNHFITRALIFGILIFIVYLLISSQYNINTQFVIGYGAIIMVLIAFQFKKLSPSATLFIKAVGFIVVMRYMYWRVFESLTYDGFFDFIGALILFSAEVFAVIIYLLGIFNSLSPLKRKVIDLEEYPKEEWPSVDILIPSYNESYLIIENTVLAAIAMDYPADKFTVNLLDDGGTTQKCTQKDEAKAQEARDRRRDLTKFCDFVGAHYVTREKNEDAKAGNLNTALKQMHNDFILILDTDHVPAKQFLKRTTGWFLKDEKIFLVQTPHAFYNEDPIERNLKTKMTTLSENDMFYKYIQLGNDFWDSAFFCGSAAVLRRSLVDELGGIAGETITEDAETAIKLHDRGYKSAYINEPMVRGLQTESFSALVLQRVRWTQGMIQIFVLKNPLLSRNLKWYQQLGYLGSVFFWFFSYSRVIFFMAPLLYLFFGLKIYNANGPEMLAYVIPHMFLAISMSYFIYGKVRNPFFSELYETVLALFTLPAIFSVLRHPRDPTFDVTPKGQEMLKDHVSDLTAPIVILFIIISFGFIAGVIRVLIDPSQLAVIAMTSVWNLLNLLLLVSALAIVSEKKELRGSIRIPINAQSNIIVNDEKFSGTIADISEGGIKFIPDTKGIEYEKILNSTPNVTIQLKDIDGNLFGIPSHFKKSFHWGEALSFTFNDFKNDNMDDLIIKQKLVQIIYGNTTKWNAMENEKPIMTPGGSFMYIMKHSFQNVLWKEVFLFTFDEIKNYFKKDAK